VLTHTWNGAVRGLKGWPREDRPPVWPVFFGFGIMVGIGLLMLAVAVIGWILRLRRRLFEAGWFLHLCRWVAPLGFVAVIAGWTTPEVGRQPWTVFGLMRTANSVSPSLTGGDVLGSLLLYMTVYLVMFPTGIVFMASMVRGGVQGQAQQREPVEGSSPKRPSRPRRSDHDGRQRTRPDPHLDPHPCCGGLLLRLCSTASI
jgi:cytochrome bd ubiquinol oxidase subunit I